MVQLTFGPFVSQYVIVIIANLGMVCVGLNGGWTSPVLVKLMDENNPPLGEPITEALGSWVVSVNYLSGLVSICLTAGLVDKLGRKNSLILFALPKIVAFILLIFVKKAYILIIARILTGISDGAIVIVVPMYASEIASKEVRGRLGVVMQISSTVGIVIMFTIGPFLDYNFLNGIVLFAIFVSIVPLIFIPESPYHLYNKGKKEEALKVLISLRGSSFLVNEEINGYNTTKNREKTMKFGEILKSKSVVRALLISILVTVGCQLTGGNPVQSYLQTILESTNTTMSSDIASVIIGLIQLTGSICTLVIIDRFGKKPIIAVCLIGMAIGLIGMGIFFTISATDEDIVGVLNYLPLASLILVIFFNSAGLGSLLTPLVAELFDGKARTFCISVSQLFGLAFLFLGIKFFPFITNSIGNAATYFFYSSCAIILLLFVVFCLPETKGKSFAEIQNKLQNYHRTEAKSMS